MKIEKLLFQFLFLGRLSTIRKTVCFQVKNASNKASQEPITGNDWLFPISGNWTLCFIVSNFGHKFRVFFKKNK